MNNMYKLLTLLLMALLATGCEQMPEVLGDFDDDNDSVASMVLSEPVFSNDYKTMVVEGRLKSGTNTVSINNPKEVKISITETVSLIAQVPARLAPQLVSVENVASKYMKQHDVRLLVLVDLTLSPAQVERERVAVQEISNLFDSKNLYIAFLDSTGVSETMPVTDYLLKNYFQPKRAERKFLYRAVLDKMNEITSRAPWTGNSQSLPLLVMSDGTVYLDDQPMDSQHFDIEQQLADRKGGFPVYYSNFSDDEWSSSDDGLFDDDDTAFDDDEDANVLQALCVRSGGLYQNIFDWTAIKRDIMHEFNINSPDYLFTLENPDHKVYRGLRGRDLDIACYDATTDSLLLYGSTHYSLGSVYNPVIVHPQPLRYVILTGIFNAVILAFFVWVIMQLIIPYIRYRQFLKHHVITYTGSQMSTANAIISQTCYLCKAPFVEGEQIVTKCQHAMHKDCWEENNYQCPEYGRHCHEGRHYYNKYNLMDRHNSSFYLPWIIVAIFAALLSWMCLVAHVTAFIEPIYDHLMMSLSEIEPGTPEATRLINVVGNTSVMPSLGLCTGFFVTAMLSLLSVSRRDWTARLIEVFARGLAGAVGGILSFTLGGLITTLLDLEDSSFLIDWIPWSLTGFWIALCVTFHTRIKLRKRMVIAAIFIGLLSTYIWTWIYFGYRFDYRVMLLSSFILFAVCMAISIAKTAPRSERYFLHVGGAMKHMDIALYKWFKSAPNSPVTIGRSVDSSLQMSWDIQSDIAPIQAEIRQSGGVLRLYALEDGVLIDNKPLTPNQGVRLYHGRQFTIGQTTFTYIEKDNC